ncbi:MAG: ribbon-helix-helix protein, CopG family [Planctomycetaceae bacterium]|nr:ribbon-helix-helix protein, CopG family [Planctomycetaceae bacterium]
MSMSLDIKLTERLKQAAKKEGRSVSYIVEQCIAKNLPLREREEVSMPLKADENIDQMLDSLAGAPTVDWLQQMGLRPTSIRWDGMGISIRLGSVESDPKEEPPEDE